VSIVGPGLLYPTLRRGFEGHHIFLPPDLLAPYSVDPDLRLKFTCLTHLPQTHLHFHQTHLLQTHLILPPSPPFLPPPPPSLSRRRWRVQLLHGLWKLVDHAIMPLHRAAVPCGAPAPCSGPQLFGSTSLRCTVTKMAADMRERL
jgi:hypothetical protein